MAMGAAAADAVVTFLWVLCASALGASTAAVTVLLGVQEGTGGHYALIVTASLLPALLFAFDLLCGALGGASFNPIDFAASYATGLDSPSLFSVALRFPTQVT
ncbi:Aquaporin SIP1-1 [Dichanthelium oligosanthes]|uniref:Aquaporin SIP1-1 n=1 Tax=Dichanthelium oligosanthes TaxID=888268 RepID=A0A1E5W250_9POAL|nr:Aquaporin SIP1-1 [Dichanthelium oligosanthes]